MSFNKRIDVNSINITEGEHRLPHWTCDYAIYHVSFRLVDAVPKSVQEQWRLKRLAIIANAKTYSRSLTVEEVLQLNKLNGQVIEQYLESGYGSCHLGKPNVAIVVADTLKHFDEKRYILHAWCIMPNHIHIIVEPKLGFALSNIIHSWKSFTANIINKEMNSRGQFWQKDAYTHIIRSEKEYHFQVDYTWKNPDKAGLKDWQWRWKCT